MRRRGTRTLVLAFLLVTALAATTGTPAQATKHHRPRWVRHVLNYSGGISNGVRERVAVAMGQTTTSRLAARSSTEWPGLNNVQMNDDTSPPLPRTSRVSR